MQKVRLDLTSYQWSELSSFDAKSKKTPVITLITYGDYFFQKI
jgi:hypothetical protein